MPQECFLQSSDLIAAELHAGEIVSLDEQLNTLRKTGVVPFMYGCWQKPQKETLLWRLQLPTTNLGT